MSGSYTQYLNPAKPERNNYVISLYKSGLNARQMVEDPEIFQKITELSGTKLSQQRIYQIIHTYKKREKRGEKHA